MNVLLKYIASSGNEYNLKTNGIKTRTANYHNWNWGVDGTTLQFGTRVANFTREAAVYETQLVFTGTYFETKALIEALHQDMELDVRNGQTGRIVWGDYYIDCYITMSSTQPDENNVYATNDLQIYCPYPFWVKEETKSFTPQEAIVGQEFLDYDYDYEYDYFTGDVGISIWMIDSPFPSEFNMTVYGPAVNPRVSINDHPYQFFDTLESNEYVIIDSRNNTITKYLADGSEVNIFDLRNKDFSIFQQVQGERLVLNWTGGFGFDLTVYEERSEPRWTA